MSLEPEEFLEYPDRFAEWIATYHYAHFEKKAEELPLRRDVKTVLTYVRDHKVVGTQSTGNMPRKHIRAVTAEFVKPPVLDTQIGDRVYKLRTEFEVWPLYFIHVLLDVGELMVTPKGGRWRLTESGEQFLEGDPLLSTLFLFSTWWYRVDWRIAVSYELDWPPALPTATLALLLSQNTGTWIDFEGFARTLDQRTGLKRPSPAPQEGRFDNTYRTMLWVVRNMIIQRLIDFGAAEGQYRYQEGVPGSTLKIERLDAFKLTWFGKALLDGLGL